MSIDKKTLVLGMLAIALMAVAVTAWGMSDESAKIVFVVDAVFAVIFLCLTSAILLTSLAATATVFLSVVFVLLLLFAFFLTAPPFTEGEWLLPLSLVLLAISMVLLVIASGDKGLKRPLFSRLAILLFICFLFVPPAYFLAVEHNKAQVAKDAWLVDMLRVLSEGERGEYVFVLELPWVLENNHGYLKHSLSVEVVGDNDASRWIRWEDEALRCQEGSVVWYKLPLGDLTGTTSVKLKFNHWGRDYRAELPLSAS